MEKLIFALTITSVSFEIILLNEKIAANLKTGSGGSRLLSGNYDLIEETEKQIAGFHNAEAALIFNSGYDANVGLLSSVPQKDDTILYDQSLPCFYKRWYSFIIRSKFFFFT